MQFTTLIPEFDADLTLVISENILDLRRGNKDLDNYDGNSEDPACIFTYKDNSYFIYIRTEFVKHAIISKCCIDLIERIRIDFIQPTGYYFQDKTLDWIFDWVYKQVYEIIK